MSILKSYWSTLRRSRLLHVLYNMRHYGQLKKNKPLYEASGVRKSVVAPIAHKDFHAAPKKSPWLDVAGAVAELENDPAFLRLPPDLQEQVRLWPERGFILLPAFIASEICEKINSEMDALIQKGAVDFEYTNSRVMNAWKKSGTICSVMNDPRLLDLFQVIFRRQTNPFQTINFLKGSQQRTHSDSIHMTTEPLGYLAATWIALENLKAGSGLLHYYPGSHRLPYIMGEDFEHSNSIFAVGDDFYANYENKIAELVEQHHLKKEIFSAQQGDLFIWHANLLHGGEPITDKSLSRKSLVTHYFCEGDVICYHEITQRPAILGQAQSCS